jgi:membrane associated rhomboid family serine protease
MTTVVRLLLLANVLAFFASVDASDERLRRLLLWPLGRGFAPWQLFTSGFLHAGFAHLATNMFGLWMFGREVERVLGAVRFTTLYFTSIATAGLGQLLFDGVTGSAAPALGASGAVFGVLVAFAMLFPRRKIILLIPPIPLPAPLFVALYAAFELFSGVYGTQAGVAHFAHLGGLVGGWATVWHWCRRES